MRRSHLLLALTALLSVALVVPAAAQTLTAEPTKPQRRVSTTSKALVRTAAQDRKVRKYWSPARMLAASPILGKGLLPETKPRNASAPGAHRWNSGGAITSTVGKVFFTLNKIDYVCTATSINSANRDTLITAGHCVNSGPGAFATNWIFVPAYSPGNEPYGRWTARTLYAPANWTERGELAHDYGYAVLNTNGGSHIADVVGTQGVTFNPARGTHIHSFGYPELAPYKGDALYLCEGDAQQDTRGTGQGIPCDMTEGSSGGPWLTDFNGNTGNVMSVNSFGYDDTPNVMYGPYLGDTAENLYGTAQKS
ncbi:MAG: hypothetical protein HOQ05_05315 [Corynebacteriales bacterium]|nr:hypothetical protein [Mycobacteriales bacterium]